MAPSPLGAPLLFLSIRVLPQEAEVVRVPKMSFRPTVDTEASIFPADTAFLLTWALLGQVY